jgi:hypothetical protein
MAIIKGTPVTIPISPVVKYLTSGSTGSTTRLGAWTPIDSSTTEGTTILLRGVSWSCRIPHAYLKLRDSQGYTIYMWVNESGSRMGTNVYDMLPRPITGRGPLSYYDSIGGNVLKLFGEYLAY